MDKQASNILENKKIRKTECRLDVLSFLLKKESAITHADLELQFVNKYDRVTLYRTIKSFLDSDIIHKVLDNESTPKYAVCNHEEKIAHHHAHNHIHFKCDKCNETTCLDSFSNSIINLPLNYFMKEINILVTGICPNCKI